MNRRNALWLSLLAGIWPSNLLAQNDDPPPRRAAKPRKIDDGDAPAEKPAKRPKAAPVDDPEADAPPANFGGEGGAQWKTIDISKYTALPHATGVVPQRAIVDWVFRRTTQAPWHGDKPAALYATKTQLRAYNTPAVLRQVDEIVERFTKAEADELMIRVRFVAAADPRWRYLVYSKLTPLPRSGGQGQQVWTLKQGDAAQILAQMEIYQGFKLIEDKEFRVVNGQTVTVERVAPVDYVVGPKRDSAVGLGVEQSTAKLSEGITLRMSPLLTYEGDALEVAVDLKADTVKKLHATKILTRREAGGNEIQLDVPEVTETRFNQTLDGWKLGQTLLIAAGIHPGILQSKSGFLRIPGTMPTSTEVLVFLDAERVDAPRVSRRKTTKDEE